MDVQKYVNESVDHTKSTYPLAWNVSKIVLGLGLIGLIMWKLPIWEILMFFTIATVVPLIYLWSVGLVTTGTVNLILSGGFRERVDKFVDEIRNEEAATAA